MDTLSRLQDWYRRQCDGDWEHDYGVKIETLDNPGWMLLIDLARTSLDGKPFERVVYQDPENEDRWMSVWTEAAKFQCACGPDDLRAAIEIFLRWAEESTGSIE
ncbi:MAG: hypothetical protein F9K41_18090 [Sphingopyxis terrae]|nr:MAG: hypothetical protein F9K41_18090 [Sphingopyxis terrae]